MFCNDVKGNQNRDAQQMLPTGAGTARAAGVGDEGEQEVTWVGQQHLFQGFCGRDPEPPRPLMLRPRRLVVRIAPRAVEEGEAGAVAKAA